MNHDEHTAQIKREAVMESRDPKTRTLLLALAILMAILIPVTGFAGYTGYQSLHDDVATQKTATGVAIGTADNNKDAAETLCKQVAALGKKCALDTDTLSTGKQAVEAQVGQRGLQGLRGVRGPQGPAPSNSLLKLLVQQALVISCPPDGNCKGQAGKAGTNGTDGISPPPAKDGTDGTNGTNGTNGKDAPKVVRGECNGSTGTLFLEDGSSFDVENMCAAPLLPTG